MMDRLWSPTRSMSMTIRRSSRLVMVVLSIQMGSAHAAELQEREVKLQGCWVQKLTETAHAELCFQSSRTETDAASPRSNRFLIACRESRFVATYRIADTIEEMRHMHDLERQSCGDFQITKSRLVAISLRKFGYPQDAYAQDCRYAFQDADRILVLGDCGLDGEWHRNGPSQLQ